MNYLLAAGIAIFSSATGAFLVVFFDLTRRRKSAPPLPGKLSREQTTASK